MLQQAWVRCDASPPGQLKHPLQVMSAAGHGVGCCRCTSQGWVVKVQRPGLRQLFDIDLKNIRVLAQWLQAVDPKSDGAARDWVAIYDECSRILYQARLTLISFLEPTGRTS